MENYYAIEVEVTNFCNAKCVFCANDKLAREKGFLNLKDFEKFILFQEKIRTNNFFYNINKNYPRITFCGLGEPLLHPEIAKLVKCAAEHDFYTQLVTNGELLNKKKLVLHPVSNNTLLGWKNLLYSIKNGIGGRRYATLHCHADKR